MPLSHAPQSCVPPQLLPMTPQYWPPIGLHGVFGQVGSLQTLALVAGPAAGAAVRAGAAVERAAAAVADGAAVADVFAAAQVSGTQPGSTQMPPRHSRPAAQAPHISLRPQPSPISPQ